MISDKRLFLTAAGAVVEDGHEDAAFLLVGAGCELPDHEAVKHGLMSAKQAKPPAEPAPVTHRFGGQEPSGEDKPEAPAAPKKRGRKPKQ